MMVLASVYLSVSASLPSTANIKPVEWWLLFNLTWPFLIIVTNIIIQVTGNRKYIGEIFIINSVSRPWKENHARIISKVKEKFKKGLQWSPWIKKISLYGNNLNANII